MTAKRKSRSIRRARGSAGRRTIGRAGGGARTGATQDRRRSPPSRSSAIWCAMSAATASTSRRWSVRTATPTSTRRRRATRRKLAAADIVFVNGLGLEGWMTRLVTASGTKAPIIVASKGVAPRKMEDERDPARMEIDPHAWQSVANAKIYVENIRDGLIAKPIPRAKRSTTPTPRPISASSTRCEREVRAAIAKIPADRRKIITTHDAFGYFSDAYGMNSSRRRASRPMPSRRPRTWPGSSRRSEQQKIPAVFMENITDPRLMQQIAQRDRRHDRRHALFRCAIRAERAGRHLYRYDAPQCRRIQQGAGRLISPTGSR